MEPIISIGIITYNRPNNLKNCIQSVEKSINYAEEKGIHIKIKDLIISDDGSIYFPLENIILNFPWKRIKGPKKGIGANRNNVIKNVKGDWCLMIDDDIELSEDFIYKSLIQLKIVDRKTILTCRKSENGIIKIPTQSNFWGYRKIKINQVNKVTGFLDQSSWFPCSIVKDCKFDESVNYGPSEMDFAYQLIYYGYSIKFVPELLVIDNGAGNTSVPKLQVDMESSRIYYMLRKYTFWERSLLKLFIFMLLEPLRLTIALMRRNRNYLRGMMLALNSYIKGISFFIKYKGYDR